MGLAAQLENTLHREIPITGEMGISVPYYDGQLLQLAAPLAPNINHKSTAFGGSLYALAVSCGWGMLHLKLQEAGLHRHIVIQEANIQYLLPVDADMVAGCALQDGDLKKFFHMLHKHGRARMTLEVLLHHKGKLAVRFTGKYVVHQ